MMRVRRIGVAAAAILTTTLGSPAPAAAQQAAEPRPSAPRVGPDGQLPAGWRITGGASGKQLVWRSADPVPLTDAGVEFYSGDRLLGRPVAAKDQRTFRLDLRAARPGRATDLQARAGGRRLDASGVTAGPDKRRTAPVAKLPAVLPANPVDPGKPGRYGTTTGEYTLPSVRLPGLDAPVEMRAVVVAPRGASGRRPLALFLHGRHDTCFTTDGASFGEWPCPSGSKPVPSHRGYLRDQKLLASQGYVTVSVSANGINGQDGVEDGGAQARSSLVRLHLARWADWAGSGRSSAPAVVRSAPPGDLSRVLLVGHSRGGEGVNRAAMDSLSRPPADQDGYRGRVRWQIRGTVLLGPTAFGQNPVPDVPSMTILPGCDGDVGDLQGQIYVDGTRQVSRGAALHSAVYMVGANHNFFNSEWTPGQATAPAVDDAAEPDPVCAPGSTTRLTAGQQQAAGGTYIAAAARLFVAGDDRVRPLLDGSNRRAPSADPARVLSHAVGGHRTAAFLPNTKVTVDGGRLCSAVADPDAATACLAPDGTGTSPHFAEWETAPEPGRRAVALRWSAPGSPVRVRSAEPASLTGAEALALRVIVPPNTTGTRLDVTIADASGRRATLGRVRVDGLPGSGGTASYWGQEIRLPLTAATRARLDTGRVTTLDITPRNRSGRAWLMDAWGWRPGTPAVRPVALPRVDVGRLTVDEGDSGTRTHQVPVRLSGRGDGQVRLFVTDPVTGRATSRPVRVRPGDSVIDVPVKAEGNTRYGQDTGQDVLVKAVHGAVVGSHHGGVTVRNDDPMPEVTVTPVADRVTEGQRLTWRATLSTVADTEVPVEFGFLAADDGAELSTTDVDPQWLMENHGESPLPERPLSTVGMHLLSAVPAGRLSTEVTIPTIADGVTEPEEAVRIQLVGFEEPPVGPVFTGRIEDTS
ncbi:alpha/beta hydrolase family protein [Streptomyces variegatus]|uniref:alpha/beta hydrolase family protein n=1 Tax=Streptomyces variegatus TaxID=284040 RepID=UPI003C2F6F52